MDTYVVLKTLHILSATVLFGTGLGIAFFMLRSRWATDLNSKLDTARATVLADFLFTAPAVIIQPVTGVALILMGEYDPLAPWLVVSYGLFILAGACWLPVVWIQIQLRNVLQDSISKGGPLPDRYDRLFRVWFVLGWPAFMGLVAIFYLMIAKPT